MTPVELNQLTGELIRYASFFSFLVAVIALIWKVVRDIIKNNEEAKNRLLDKQHSKNLHLQQEKAELQKQLEAEKKRYIEKMIEEVKNEIEKMDDKLDKVINDNTKLTTHQENNEKRYTEILNQVQDYYKMTEKNLGRIENKEKSNCSQINQIKESIKTIDLDIIMLKKV